MFVKLKTNVNIEFLHRHRRTSTSFRPVACKKNLVQADFLTLDP